MVSDGGTPSADLPAPEIVRNQGKCVISKWFLAVGLWLKYQGFGTILTQILEIGSNKGREWSPHARFGSRTCYPVICGRILACVQGLTRKLAGAAVLSPGSLRKDQGQLTISNPYLADRPEFETWQSGTKFRT